MTGKLYINRDHTQCQEGSVCVIWTKCQKRNGIFRGMCGSHGTFFVCCQMTHVVEQTVRFINFSQLSLIETFDFL